MTLQPLAALAQHCKVETPKLAKYGVWRLVRNELSVWASLTQKDSVGASLYIFAALRTPWESESESESARARERELRALFGPPPFPRRVGGSSVRHFRRTPGRAPEVEDG